jgi:hypothetical protein
MKSKLVIPFTTEQKGGSKKTFKLLNDTEINNKMTKNPNLMNFVKKLLFKNEQEKNKSETKVNYVKASTTKNYYKNINNKIFK